MLEEKYEFKSSLKRTLFIIMAVGVVLFGIGVMQVSSGGGHHEEVTASTEAAVAHDHDAQAENAHGEEATQAEGEEVHEAGGHHEYHWTQRLFANLWINNVFFIGLSIIGVFFFALQWAASAGWSAGIIRIPMAFGSWLPIAFILMVAVFAAAMPSHALFHWLDPSLYIEDGPNYDSIIAGKRGYLNVPFYAIRGVVFFGVWYLLFKALRKNSLNEDLNPSDSYWRKNRTLATIFIIFFGLSSSSAAWDWVLSIDTHWFSTMFGWYVFASWFVSGLAAITLIVVFLKEAGYLKVVNANHIHDLGKFVFAFSIFWTYIWFSQFLLIYYANIPEETYYFVERWKSDHYAPYFFINLILNFFFPFLMLMTRDAKRQIIFLKIVCFVVLFGHWIDFYLMVTPGTLKENGGFGFLEIGLIMIYATTFLFVVLRSLAKNPLVAKNHPMLEESLHHHI